MRHVSPSDVATILDESLPPETICFFILASSLFTSCSKLLQLTIDWVWGDPNLLLLEAGRFDNNYPICGTCLSLKYNAFWKQEEKHSECSCSVSTNANKKLSCPRFLVLWMLASHLLVPQFSIKVSLALLWQKSSHSMLHPAAIINFFVKTKPCSGMVSV